LSSLQKNRALSARVISVPGPLPYPPRGGWGPNTPLPMASKEIE
jgi:hypothetical protein